MSARHCPICGFETKVITLKEYGCGTVRYRRCERNGCGFRYRTDEVVNLDSKKEKAEVKKQVKESKCDPCQ